MNSLAIVLSGHDDSCARSHSLRNLLLFFKVRSVINSRHLDLYSIDIYAHPSEFLFLYRMIAKRIFSDLTINVKRNCRSLSEYDHVIGCFSSVYYGVEHSSIEIYDPALTDEYILANLDNVKIL